MPIAVLATEGDQLGLREVRVQLDLVDRWPLLGREGRHQRAQHLHLPRGVGAGEEQVKYAG